MKKFAAILLTVGLSSALLCGCGKETKTEQSLTLPPAAPTAAVSDATTQAATQPVTLDAEGKVAPSWFDDAVFVGDSITTTLDYLCGEDPGLLGNAQFVCADSLSYHNAQWHLNDENAVHPQYRGETVLAERAAELTGASKMFILMGINDVDTYGVEDTMDSLKEFVRKILTHSPNVQLYFQSTTPMITDLETDILNNEIIREFDGQLQAYCNENGYHYIDLYHQMCDDTGALRDDYCVDPDADGVHFTDEACIIWANYLKTAGAG